MRGANMIKEDGAGNSAEEEPSKHLSYNDAPVQALNTLRSAKLFPALWFDCGEFRTKDVRSPRNPEHVTVGEIYFKLPSCYTRDVLLGFNELDVNILRLKAEVRSVADDCAIVNMTTWADTKHYGSGCSWLSLPTDDPDIQWGSYDTIMDRCDAKSQQQMSRRIFFARPYAVPPKVVVWLNAVDSGAGRNVRVTVWADGITSDGFTIHLDTWGDSSLCSAGATWLAHSTGRTDVRSGAFDIEDVRPSSASHHKNRGRVSWGVPEMARPPRVFTALRMLEFQNGKNIRLITSTSRVTTTGMTWHMDSRDDTVFYQAGAVFVAFDDMDSQ
ncbi:uncharacterized protein PHACADRAFT_205296 [Phanerochaete carnosa HHB-10118-sp]|uniref:H-type lectin domain-containing protein n=1 Tax=Phanerochaete carnosa (strain HHB-10118-sp) TaxID=650164 RepID=K5W5C3_PHACS|nr:uncharacterized protein PHACADRAFT_205296 [Phanerochaete carnosa HHB-10118-sp]EKM59118.1 hypothetical protein PHACADRAFT_205296 [Phanerochaete carnosa HHB-10118-sp]